MDSGGYRERPKGTGSKHKLNGFSKSLILLTGANTKKDEKSSQQRRTEESELSQRPAFALCISVGTD